MDEITFEVREHIGTITTRPSGWSKEINVVVWNSGEPKIDIRDWDSEHTRMSRGITLTEEEAETLYNVLKKRYEGVGFE